MPRAFLGKSFTAPKCAGDHSTNIYTPTKAMSSFFPLSLSLSAYTLPPTSEALVDLRPTPEKEPGPGCFSSCFDSH